MEVTEDKQDKLVSVEEVADHMGLSAYTVRRLARTKQIPAGKIGRVYRFKLSDIDQYLRSQYPGGPGEV